MPLVFTDVEGAVKAWAIAHADINAATSGRVFFGVPSSIDFNSTANFPFITIYRSGGSPKAGPTPLDIARITFDCWGSTKAQAASVATVVVDAVEKLSAGTQMGASARTVGAETRLILWRPDPATNAKRYVVDADFTVRSA